MEPLALWEQIALGLIAMLVLIWMAPGIKTTLRESSEAESDWPGFLKPLAVVILFIIVLIMAS